MKFTLSLRTGGLMEDPEWHYEGIKSVEASSLKEAKNKYAEFRGFLKNPNWNSDKQTLWRWEIVDMVEEMKNYEN
jgi:hypothetical protein